MIMSLSGVLYSLLFLHSLKRAGIFKTIIQNNFYQFEGCARSRCCDGTEVLLVTGLVLGGYHVQVGSVSLFSR